MQRLQIKVVDLDWTHVVRKTHVHIQLLSLLSARIQVPVWMDRQSPLLWGTDSLFDP